MKRRPLALSLLAAAAVLSGSGCSLPGRPAPGPEVPRPDAILDGQVLYQQNCSGCHGVEGKLGAAIDLSDPQYQALVDDATLHAIIAGGQPGSLMPPFAGNPPGSLSDQQIDAIVRYMRTHWYKGNVLAGLNPPPYRADAPGDSHAGEAVYASHCAICHGDLDGPPGMAGAILNGSFLALLPAQSIRTTVIVGRSDLGMPDWRHEVRRAPLSHADVNNVVAFLETQRPTRPGEPYQQPEPPRPTPPGTVPPQQQGVHGEKTPGSGGKGK